MTYRGDFTGAGKAVPLHSEIRDVHRLAADVDYFFAKLNKLKQVFRARMLSHVALRNQTLTPLPLRRGRAGREKSP